MGPWQELFVAAKPSTSTPQPGGSTASEKTCKTGFEDFVGTQSDFCYKISSWYEAFPERSSSSSGPWSEAELYCSQIGRRKFCANYPWNNFSKDLWHKREGRGQRAPQGKFLASWDKSGGGGGSPVDSRKLGIPWAYTYYKI